MATPAEATAVSSWTGWLLGRLGTARFLRVKVPPTGSSYQVWRIASRWWRRQHGEKAERRTPGAYEQKTDIMRFPSTNRAGQRVTSDFQPCQCYRKVLYCKRQLNKWVFTGAPRNEERLGNGVEISDRTAAVRQNDGSVYHWPRAEKMIHSNEAESEDLPVKIHVWFFGLKNDMPLAW